MTLMSDVASFATHVREENCKEPEVPLSSLSCDKYRHYWFHDSIKECGSGPKERGFAVAHSRNAPALFTRQRHTVVADNYDSQTIETRPLAQPPSIPPRKATSDQNDTPANATLPYPFTLRVHTSKTPLFNREYNSLDLELRETKQRRVKRSFVVSGR